MSIAVQKNKNLFFFHTSCPLADQCSATTGNPRLDSRSSKRSAFLLELLIPINCKSNHHRNKNHSKNRQLWHTTSMSLVSKSLPFHYRNLEVEGSHPQGFTQCLRWMCLLHAAVLVKYHDCWKANSPWSGEQSLGFWSLKRSYLEDHPTFISNLVFVTGTTPGLGNIRSPWLLTILNWDDPPSIWVSQIGVGCWLTCLCPNLCHDWSC